jgi:hypothetical protein
MAHQPSSKYDAKSSKNPHKLFPDKRSKTEFQNGVNDSSSELPVRQCAQSFLKAYREHSTIVLVAETGSGKSTQIPRILMEEGLVSEMKGLKLVCTQPRRMAAVTLAERVAFECGVSVGDQVGYAVRFDDKASNNQNVIRCVCCEELYCTIIVMYMQLKILVTANPPFFLSILSTFHFDNTKYNISHTSTKQSPVACYKVVIVSHSYIHNIFQYLTCSHCICNIHIYI